MAKCIREKEVSFTMKLSLEEVVLIRLLCGMIGGDNKLHIRKLCSKLFYLIEDKLRLNSDTSDFLMSKASHFGADVYVKKDSDHKFHTLVQKVKEQI